MKIIYPLLLTFLLAGCSTSNNKKDGKLLPAKLPASLEEAVASEARNPENKKRDQYRHPEETLNFFGIRSNMTVVEVSPGAGWYTEILAPYLAAQGQYIMAVPTIKEDSPTYVKENAEKVKAIINSHPEVASKVVTTTFNPPKEMEIVQAGTADMVLTFRNVHNWMAAGAADQAFKAFYKALKPGGVLGVVDHRENPKKKFDPKNGYVPVSEVIESAKKAGFRLAGRSEINANPKDTKNHPEGVWTLPPSLRLGDKDRAKYIEIGESDRMTLKFVKPKK